MATLDTTARLTLAELTKRRDPKGDAAVIAEVLSEDNPILQHAPWVEANGVTFHKYVRRLSLPSGSWRKLNQGVDAEASSTIEVLETLGMLESFMELDRKLIQISPNEAQFIMSEATAFLEGLSQTFATTLFYGNATVNSEQFTGLAPRLAALSQDNVESAGGSGDDLTSIYVVQWGASRTHLIYPKGSKTMGVNRDKAGDGLGFTVLKDGEGKDYLGYKEHYGLEVGLGVKDERAIARLCNIESSGTSNTFDEDHLIRLTNKLKANKKGAHIYVNDTIYSQMQIKLKDKNNVNFTQSSGDGLSGGPIMRFNGIPVDVCDAILNTESTVS